MSKKRKIILGHLTYVDSKSGKRHGPGSELTLDVDEARFLVESGKAKYVSGGTTAKAEIPEVPDKPLDKMSRAELAVYAYRELEVGNGFPPTGLSRDQLLADIQGEIERRADAAGGDVKTDGAKADAGQGKLPAVEGSKTGDAKKK